MRTVILVPRRDGVPERDAVWQACKARWQFQLPDIEIFEGHHDEGPFNRSIALNRAADAAGDWDMAVIIDSDVFIRVSQVFEGITKALDSGKIVWPFTQWKGLSERGSREMMRGLRDWDGDDIEALVEKTNPVSWSCCIVVPRAAWDKLGGFDERFRGWGFEDMAFQSAAVGLVGHERMPGAVYHLWHPRSPGLGKGAGMSVDSVRNARLGRRYMVAVRRDYGMTDRLTYTDEAEMERDIANLKRDDAKYSDLWKRRLRQPDWDQWWPTLEELTEGAKESRGLAARQTVTVAVHTDGRREYIEQSIPSLEAQVKGDVVKRVIYDDSGDPEYKAWLREAFGPLGYFVVGPEKRLGYTGSMSAMWSYLSRRCDSKWVFLAEDDFTYDVPVDLDRMALVLDINPHLRQLALLRHPYYPREFDAGSIIAEHPDDYDLKGDDESDTRWMEHRLYFTANPSLFSRDLCAREPWPAGVKSSERVYTDRLNRDPKSRMAYLGHGEETVTHIGAVRAGSGY